VLSQAFRAEEKTFDFAAVLIQNDSRVAHRRAPAFLKQRASDGRRLPLSRDIRQDVFVGPAWGERSINEKSVSHRSPRVTLKECRPKILAQIALLKALKLMAPGVPMSRLPGETWPGSFFGLVGTIEDRSASSEALKIRRRTCEEKSQEVYAEPRNITIARPWPPARGGRRDLGEHRLHLHKLLQRHKHLRDWVWEWRRNQALLISVPQQRASISPCPDRADTCYKDPWKKCQPSGNYFGSRRTMAGQASPCSSAGSGLWEHSAGTYLAIL
jgi:hypothetical protein